MSTLKKVFKAQGVANYGPPATIKGKTIKAKKTFTPAPKELAGKKINKPTVEKIVKVKAEKPAKVKKEKTITFSEAEVKNEFVSKGGKLIFDRPIKEGQRVILASAVRDELKEKGWDFVVEDYTEGGGEQFFMTLTPKMDQGNISRQRNVMSGFVSGFLKARNI